MSHASASQIARSYLNAWSEGRYEHAATFLAEGIVVEVPINTYPTKASFVEALITFGNLVTEVDLLAEMESGSEAMQLYDMRVAGLGTVRVVEHFTLDNGAVVRLRQIHDTAPFRNAA